MAYNKNLRHFIPYADYTEWMGIVPIINLFIIPPLPYAEDAVDLEWNGPGSASI